MIAAAKSDGHVNKKETEIINEKIQKLGISNDVSSLLEAEIAKPLEVKEIAAMAENTEMAAEIYLVSAVVTDKENSMEREYLESLAKSMELPTDLIAQLDSAKDEGMA